jgi:hypothetical protein
MTGYESLVREEIETPNFVFVISKTVLEERALSARRFNLLISISLRFRQFVG